jgi:hypothetical protein
MSQIALHQLLHIYVIVDINNLSSHVAYIVPCIFKYNMKAQGKGFEPSYNSWNNFEHFLPRW